MSIHQTNRNKNELVITADAGNYARHTHKAASGTVAVQVGQVVRQGDVLISGATKAKVAKDRHQVHQDNGHQVHAGGHGHDD